MLEKVLKGLLMLIAMESQGAAIAVASSLEVYHYETTSVDHHRAPESPDGELQESSDYAEVTKSALQENSCRLRPARMPRSCSQDRRKNESDQFFEAVGEMPPISVNHHIEIVDTTGEESPDDEESTFEVQALTIPAKSAISGPPRIGGILRVSPFRTLTNDSANNLQCPIREDLDYRGIGENGLAITKRGVQRGNHATLHRKAWLEVSDSKHRYGKNLRLYYRHWQSLGYPTNNFFDWLDGKRNPEGHPLPDLPECPRSRLEADTVLYITDAEVSKGYALAVMSNHEDRRGRILGIDGEPVVTGPEGWIFVLRDNILYGSQKVAAVSRHSKQRFHHSSFFGGKAVSAAGIFITDQDGFLTAIYPHSGHYRPGEADMQRCLCYLYSQGVDLESIKVDMQQIIHMARQKDAQSDSNEKKKNKMSCLYLESALSVAYYLSHKAECIDRGIFRQIEQIDQVRSLGATRVADILESVDCIASWHHSLNPTRCSITFEKHPIGSIE